jgi:hypothetical protein
MLERSFISKSAMAGTMLALALAVFSTTSAFAAPANTSSHTSIDLARVWGSQFRELQTDRAIYDKLKAHPVKTSSKPAQIQQYLDQYRFALKQAEAIIALGNPGSVSNVKVNNRYERSLTAQQELAMYLHMIRGLQDKFKAM